MVHYGMKPLAVLQADMINGAKLLGWEGQIGELKPGYFADIVAVPGNPLDDIGGVEHVSFVMKGGSVVREAVNARLAGSAVCSCHLARIFFKRLSSSAADCSDCSRDSLIALR